MGIKPTELVEKKNTEDAADSPSSPQTPQPQPSSPKKKGESPDDKDDDKESSYGQHHTDFLQGQSKSFDKEDASSKETAESSSFQSPQPQPSSAKKKGESSDDKDDDKESSYGQHHTEFLQGQSKSFDKEDDSSNADMKSMADTKTSDSIQPSFSSNPMANPSGSSSSSANVADEEQQAQRTPSMGGM